MTGDGLDDLRRLLSFGPPTTQARQAKVPAAPDEYLVKLEDCTVDARLLLDDIMVVCGALRRARRKNIVRNGKPIRGWKPALTVRRTRGGGCSGHCAMADRSIVVSVGPGVDGVRFAELLIHEAVHAVLPKDAHHDRRFKLILARACAEYFGIEVGHREVRRAYGLDDLIIGRARDAGWTPTRGVV